MRTLMLGAGGIGGYFGARLLQAGADVTFLVRPRRQAQLLADGLVVETPTERLRLQVRTVTADDLQRADTPAFDLVMLSPKAYDLDDAMASVRHAPGEPVLLPLLNGYDHLDTLDHAFGARRIMGGVAHVAAMLAPDGTVKQLSPMHSLTFGHRHPAQRALAHELETLCAGTAFDSQRSDDIEQVLWDKWVFLATLAAMTTLARASVGAIMATPWGEQATRAMYGECCAVAAHHGHPIAQPAVDKALGLLLQPGSAFTASMLRDLQAGQRTEHDHILGSMARRGHAAGLSVTGLMLAHVHMACAKTW